MTIMQSPCLRVFVVSLLFIFATGCQGPRRARLSEAPGGTTLPTMGFSNTIHVASVEAIAAPPDGWRMDPLKATENHAHQVWVSPSGKTAYGIIRFRMPLPLSTDLALGAFLREMRRTEGVAKLVEKKRDPELPGIRFIAEGGLYTVRTNLMVRGLRGWAVYAGTLTGQEIVEYELEIAEEAREHTAVDVVKPPTSQP